MKSEFTNSVRQARDEQRRRQEEKGRTDELIAAVQSSGSDTKSEVTTAIHDLMLATLVSKDPRLVEVAQKLTDLIDQIDEATGKLGESGLSLLPDIHSELVDALRALPEQVSATDKSPELIPYLQELIKTVRSKDTRPSVSVEAPKLDLKPLQTVLMRMEAKLAGPDNSPVDIAPLQEGIDAVEKAVRDLIARPVPIPETAYPFKTTGNVGIQPHAVASTSDATKTGIVVLNPDGSNISAGGGGGASATDDAAFTAASGSGTPIMGFVTADSVDSGDVGVIGMLANRQLKVTLYDSGGSELAVGGGTQYTEDAAAAANPVGNMLITRRKDTLSGSEVSADGDNIAVNATAKGEIYVKQTDAVPVTDNSGSLTVDNGGTFAVQAAQSGTWNVTNVSGTVSLPTGASTLAEQQTQTASLSVMDDWDNTASDGASVSGDVAHDGVDAGEPVKLGFKAIAHGANPTAVAANDRTNWYSNRHGIPWVIGGHPNVITKEFTFADADGAQTNAALVTVSAGTKIVVTKISVTADGANSDDVGVRIGFAAATLSAVSTSGVTGIVLSHPGIVAGSGVVEGGGMGILGVGGDDEDLRITSEDPTGGSIRVVVSYYTVES